MRSMVKLGETLTISPMCSVVKRLLINEVVEGMEKKSYIFHEVHLI